MGGQLHSESCSKKTMAYRWVVLFSLASAYFFVQFYRICTTVIRDDLATEFALNATSFSALTATYLYAYMLMQLPGGMLLDRYGVRKVVAIGSLVAAIGSLVFGLAQNFAMLCLGRFIIGIGVSTPVVSMQKLLPAWFQEEKVASATGVGVFIAFMGGVVAQMPFAMLAEIEGWRGAAIISAGVSATVSLLCAVAIRNSPQEMGLAPVAGQAKQLPRHNKVKLKSTQVCGQILRNKHIWVIMLVLSIHQSVFTVFSATWCVPFLKDAFGYSSIEASAYATYLMMGMIVSGLFAGLLSDLLRSRKAIIVAISAILSAIWLLMAFRGEWMARPIVTVVVMFLAGVTACSVQIIFATMRELNNPEYAASAVGLANTVAMTVTAMLPTVCGRILDHYSDSLAGVALYQKAFFPLAVMSLISLVASFFITETNCRNRYYEL